MEWLSLLSIQLLTTFTLALFNLAQLSSSYIPFLWCLFGATAVFLNFFFLDPDEDTVLTRDPFDNIAPKRKLKPPVKVHIGIYAIACLIPGVISFQALFLTQDLFDSIWLREETTFHTQLGAATLCGLAYATIGAHLLPMLHRYSNTYAPISNLM
jgi:hypothetical protein